MLLKGEMKGIWNLTLFHPDGSEEKFQHQNMIVYTGRNAMIAGLVGSLVSAYNNANSYIAVGTGNAFPQISDTQLQLESARVAMDATYPIPAGSSALWRTTFTAGVATGTLREAGLFNAAASGDMFNRVGLTVTKGALDVLQVEFLLQVM